MCHDRDYAIRIARDWNVPASGSGFVTRFDVRADVASRYPAKIVGGSQHSELWVPAEELDEFNDAIVSQIEVTDRFSSDWFSNNRYSSRLPEHRDQIASIVQKRPDDTVPRNWPPPRDERRGESHAWRGIRYNRP